MKKDKLEYWIEYGECACCGKKHTRGIEMWLENKPETEIYFCKECLKEMLNKLSI